MASNPPPPQTPASGCASPDVKSPQAEGFNDWSRIISNSIVVILIVLLWAGSQSVSRIPLGVRQMESIEMSVQLRDAVEQFHDGGRLPLPVTGSPATGDLNTNTGMLPGLVTVLAGKELIGPSHQNPRGTNYVDGMTRDLPLSQFSVVDSWGNLYRVRLDTDGDGSIENPCIDEVAEGRPLLKQRVIVWSPGRDGKEETWTDNPKSWD